MTSKDQELIAEAYMTEVFGFGSKPEMIDLKKQLDPETFNIVSKVFRINPDIREFVQSCKLGSCLVDKNKLPKICSILKRQYESSHTSDQKSDDIIDTHDALSQVYQPTSGYKSTIPPQHWEV